MQSDLRLQNVIAGHHVLLRLSDFASNIGISLFRSEFTNATITTVSWAEALALWLWDLLLSREIIRDHWRGIKIIANIKPAIEDITNTLLRLLESGDDLPPILMSIADRRYLIMPNAPIFDMMDITSVDTLPPTFEGITYNISMLFSREYHRIMDAKHEQRKAD